MFTFIVTCFRLGGRICATVSFVGFCGLQFGRALRAQSWQVNEERAPLADSTFYPNAAVVQFDDLAANKQSKTRSADGACSRVVDAVEFLEQMWNVVGWNTCTGVLDVHLDDFGVASQAD